MKKILFSIICFFAFVLTTNAQILFGTTRQGGAEAAGTIGRFDASTSTLTVAQSFESLAAHPYYGQCIQASDGKIYGMTTYGGSSNYGVIFSYDPSSGIYNKLRDFDWTTGAYPYGSLMQASDGKLYGMTSYGGSHGVGTIFFYDPSTDTYSNFKDFDNDGHSPYGSLIQASDGKLYGMTTYSGTSGFGIIFSYDLSSSSYTVLKDFTNTNDGAYPYGSLVQANDGKLYGMTYQGGSGYGVIFSYDPSSNNYSKLKDFDYSSGGYPYGSLMQASDGKLYGMAQSGGGRGSGVIFSFDPSAGTYSDLKDLDIANGSSPYGGLIEGSDGKLYGMTTVGGYGGAGVIFSYDRLSSSYSNLNDFDLSTGGVPYGSLMQATDGKFYGMTYQGGNIGSGAIFSYDPVADSYSVVKDFGTNVKGTTAAGTVVKGSDGKLYGMTTDGGSEGFGVIYSYDPSNNTYTKLKDFDHTNGSNPYGSLTPASDGKLYGMTTWGSSGVGVSAGTGVIFSYDPSSGIFSKLKDFDYASGESPYGSLMQANDGKLYGMTSGGGSAGYGVIFSYDPSSASYTIVKDFDNTSGANPRGSLLQASNGKLYGMTSAGGSNGFGVIFSYDPSTNLYSDLKDFDNTNGSYPYGSLTQANDGKLYGMTSWGSSFGVIFAFDPTSGQYSKLKDFDYYQGAYPYGSLMLGSDGKLYGMTGYGGGKELGVIFSYDPSSGTYSKLQDYIGPNGSHPLWGSAFIELSNDNIVLSCVADKVVNTDAGTCSAIVTGIDPSITPESSAVTYEMSGATIRTGTGTVSGKTFNEGITTVTYTSVDDPAKTCSFKVTVNNSAPVITTITVPVDPVAVNIAVNLTGDYTDNNASSASIDWGDNTTASAASISSNPFTASHTYTAAGVYTANVTVTDACNVSSDPAKSSYIVIYDPSAGFVSGNGWINSPVVSELQYMQVAGIANFGFVSKYQKGKTVPMGNTQFEFNSGGLYFVSTNYEWLVISGSRAQFKGSGTINGSGNYGFLLTAIDGKLTATSSPDRFRIKIWDVATGVVVYDNQNASSDAGALTSDYTQLGAGSIVIHTPKNNKREMNTTSAEPLQGSLTITALPNPTAQYFKLNIKSSSKETLTIRVTDILGRILETKANIPANGSVQFGSYYRPGVYFAEIMQGKERKIVKLVKLSE